MTRGRPVFLFALALCLLLLFQFRHLLAPGHSLYLSIIDDPGAWWSWYPWDVFSARAFRSGHFPLWNPLSGTGFPHLANFASNVFSPLKWPFYFFPHYRLLDAMVLSRVLLLGVFMFLYLRRLLAENAHREIAATAGALALALSGYVMESANIFNLATELLLPAGLYLLHGQIMDRPTRRRFLLLALVSALALTGGNPEAAFYYVLVLALYALALGGEGRKIVNRLLAAGSPIILAGLLITIQGIPLVEYLGQGWHVHTGKLHALAEFSPRHFWSLLLPWLAGENRASPLQIFMLPYLGVVTATLAAVAFIHLTRKDRPLLFFLLYPLVFLGLIYDVRPFAWLGEIPPFRQSGNFKFAMAGITLCLAAAAALGLARILSGRLERRRTALALGLMTALVFFGIALAWKDPALPRPQMAGWFWGLVLLIALAALARLAQARPGRSIALLLAALPALELMILYPGLRPQGQIDPAAVAAVNPVAPAYLDPIKDDPDRFRFTGWGSVTHHSLNLLYGVNDLRAFEALYPRDYVQTLAEIEGFALKDSVAAFFQHGWSFDVAPENLGHPLIDRLGVKYFLSSEEITPPPGWTLLRRDGAFVYENREVYPRAYLENDIVPVHMTSYGNDFVAVAVETPQPGTLVLTDTDFPGWIARVNGREARIVKHDGLVRAVEIPAGKAIVEMIYRPWGFRIGLWGTITALMLLAIAAFPPLFRRPAATGSP